MPVNPGPYLITEEWQRHVYELMYASMRGGTGIDTREQVMRKLTKIWGAVREGRAVDKADQELVEELYVEYAEFITPEDRVVDPPEGYPGYHWPEHKLQAVRSHADFAPEWAKDSPEVSMEINPLTGQKHSHAPSRHQK